MCLPILLKFKHTDLCHRTKIGVYFGILAPLVFTHMPKSVFCVRFSKKFDIYLIVSRLQKRWCRPRGARKGPTLICFSYQFRLVCISYFHHSISKENIVCVIPILLSFCCLRGGTKGTITPIILIFQFHFKPTFNDLLMMSPSKFLLKFILVLFKHILPSDDFCWTIINHFQ